MQAVDGPHSTININVVHVYRKSSHSSEDSHSVVLTIVRFGFKSKSSKNTLCESYLECILVYSHSAILKISWSHFPHYARTCRTPFFVLLIYCYVYCADTLEYSSFLRCVYLKSLKRG